MFRKRRRKGCFMGIIDLIETYTKWKNTQSISKYVPMDNLSGHQFEDFLAKLFRDLGYKVERTGKSGDFGADLIVTIANTRRVIQAKRYSNKVGIRAVQEVLGAKRFYSANGTGVVTTNYFTPAAKKLAAANDVLLIDRDGLSKLITKRNQGKTSKGKVKAKGLNHWSY